MLTQKQVIFFKDINHYSRMYRKNLSTFIYRTTNSFLLRVLSTSKTLTIIEDVRYNSYLPVRFLVSQSLNKLNFLLQDKDCDIERYKGRLSNIDRSIRLFLQEYNE